MKQKLTSTNVWMYYSHIQKLLSIYEKDFAKENKKLKDRSENLQVYLGRKKESEIDMSDLTSFCVTEWKLTINTAIDLMLDKIDKRKTKGAEFATIKSQLNKIKEDVNIDDLDIDKYEKIYENDLKGFREQIKEKIDIEKYNNKRFWVGFLLGGGLASLVISTLFFLFN